MFIWDMLFALILTILVIALLAPSERYAGRSGAAGLAFFFLLFFPLIWLGGAWMTPVGPPIAGVYWLSFVLPAFFLLALLFALDPGPRVRQVADTGSDEFAKQEQPDSVEVTFSIFFWVLLVCAIVALILRYA